MNIQAAPQAPLPVLPAPQGPQVILAVLAHKGAVENADAVNQTPANQNPGLPEPLLEVKLRAGFLLSYFLSFLPLHIF